MVFILVVVFIILFITFVMLLYEHNKQHEYSMYGSAYYKCCLKQNPEKRNLQYYCKNENLDTFQKCLVYFSEKTFENEKTFDMEMEQKEKRYNYGRVIINIMLVVITYLYRDKLLNWLKNEDVFNVKKKGKR